MLVMLSDTRASNTIIGQQASAIIRLHSSSADPGNKYPFSRVKKSRALVQCLTPSFKNVDTAGYDVNHVANHLHAMNDFFPGVLNGQFRQRQKTPADMWSFKCCHASWRSRRVFFKKRTPVRDSQQKCQHIFPLIKTTIWLLPTHAAQCRASEPLPSVGV